MRQAVSEDYDALMLLEQKVIDAERPHNSSLKRTDIHYYDIKTLMSDPSCRLIVGEISETIIATGYVHLRQSKASLKHDRHGYLGFMYVADAYRGLGLNKVILQNLVSWSQSHGVTNFYLDVYLKNRSAIRAYEKFGFRGSLLKMKLDIQEPNQSK